MRRGVNHHATIGSTVLLTRLKPLRLISAKRFARHYVLHHLVCRRCFALANRRIAEGADASKEQVHAG